VLKFLIDNIFVVVGEQVFQQFVVIPMGINCAPVLPDIFLCSYKVDFMLKFQHEEKRSLAVAFNWTFRYIDDVLSINNDHFHSYVDLILVYPSELEIKDTTKSSTSVSYLDILLRIDTGGKLTTQLHGKGDVSNFSIVNFPYLHVCITYQHLLSDHLLHSSEANIFELQITICLIWK
jgi:hypothetical protein